MRRMRNRRARGDSVMWWAADARMPRAGWIAIEGTERRDTDADCAHPVATGSGSAGRRPCCGSPR
jgi:hypothetical protein